MKLTKLVGFTFATVAVLFFAACKKDNNNNQTVHQGTPPPFLQVGHEWRYYSESFFTPTDTVIVKILSVDSYNTYTVSQSSKALGTKDERWFMDGTSLKGYIVGEEDTASTIWKTDAVVGDHWKSQRTTSVGAYNLDSVTVLDTSQVTLSGTYNHLTIVYSTFSDAFNDQSAFWNNDVGLVYIDNAFYPYNLYYKNF